MEWSGIPLVRLLIPFSTGIWLAYRFEVYFPWFIPAAFLLVCVFWWIFLKRKTEVIFRRVGSILFLAAFLISGNTITVLKLPSANSGDFSKIKGQIIEVVIAECPQEKEKSFKAFADITGVSGREEKFIGETVLLYFSKDSLPPKYGDRIIFRSKIEQPPAPGNPGQFDQRKFLFRKSVVVQQFLKKNQYRRTEQEQGNIIISSSLKLRDFFLGKLQQHGVQGQEYSVGSALILGHDDELDSELMKSYSAAGVLHVLSVSGLHVAIIYWILNVMFSFLDKNEKQRWIKCFLIILLIWFYACLTGLSPSVLRSAAMFSFILLGQGFRKHVNMINILAASAFLLLCIDPALLMNIGFQLSYLAVGGIVLLHLPVSRLYEPGNKIMSWIWSVVAISLVAQIATLPVTLYYFHSFPLYFLIANLIIIPLSSAILYGGVALFMLCWVPFAGDGVGWLLSKTIWITNSLASLFQQLPSSVIQTPFISELGAWILLIIIFTSVQAVLFKSKTGLILSLMLLNVVIFQAIIRDHSIRGKSSVTVLNLQSEKGIIISSGTEANFIYPDSIPSQKAFHYNINSFIYDQGTEIKKTLRASGFRINDKTFYYASSGKIPPSGDFLIFPKGAKTSEKYLSRLRTKYIIADASATSWQKQKLKDFCNANKIKFHSIKEEGAFSLDL